MWILCIGRMGGCIRMFGNKIRIQRSFYRTRNLVVLDLLFLFFAFSFSWLIFGLISHFNFRFLTFSLSHNHVHGSFGMFFVESVENGQRPFFFFFTLFRFDSSSSCRLWYLSLRYRSGIVMSSRLCGITFHWSSVFPFWGCCALVWVL